MLKRKLAAILAVVLIAMSVVLATQKYWPAAVDEIAAGPQEAEPPVTADDLTRIESDFTVSPITFRDLIAPELRTKLEGFGRKFSDESMPGVSRIFSDSVAKPVELSALKSLMDEFEKASVERRRAIEKEIVKAAKGSEAMILDEMLKQIILNPVYTRMVIEGLKDLRPAGEDRKRIGELNPWMDEYLKSMDEAYADETVGIAAFLVKNAAGELEVSEKQLTAGWMTALLVDRFKMIDVNKYKTNNHFGLAVVANPLLQRAERMSYEEDLPALKLAILLKDVQVRATTCIGFNLLDKRLEILPVVGQQKPKPEVKVVPGKTKVIEKTRTRIEYRDRIIPGDTKYIYVPCPTPTPTPTPPPVRPTPTPTPPPVRPTPPPKDGEGWKDPKADPAEQGNAPIGGGPNQPKDGDGGYQPTPPVKPPSNEDPVPIVPEKPLPDPAPAPAPTPTPPPSPEPGDNLTPPPTDPIKPTPPEPPIKDDPPFEGEIPEP